MAYLGVSRSWVYAHVQAGLLPCLRLPGSSLLRFRPAEIEAYVEGRWQPRTGAVVDLAAGRGAR
jgi:excisionase family DNA binding protein